MGLRKLRYAFKRRQTSNIALCFLWCFLLITGPLNTALATQQKLELVVMGYLHFPPHSYSVNGRATGSQLDLAHQIFARMGQNYKMVELPAARLYRALASGFIHVWMGANGVPELAEKTLASKLVTGHIRMRLYSMRKEDPVNFDQLKGQKLITISGFTYNDKIKRIQSAEMNLTLLETTAHRTAFLMLDAGRADYLLNYELPSKIAIAKMGIRGLSSELIEEVLLYHIVSKKAPQPEALLSLMVEGSKLVLAEK